MSEQKYELIVVGGGPAGLAAAYAAYPTNGGSRGQRLYAELTDAAAPWGTARWIAVAVTVIACVVLAVVAHKRAKQN